MFADTARRGRGAGVEVLGVDDVGQHEHRRRPHTSTCLGHGDGSQWFGIEDHLTFQPRLDHPQPPRPARPHHRPAQSCGASDSLVADVEHPGGRPRHGQPVRR